MSAEREFEELAETISAQAARVECSAEEYQEGLRTLINRLETDLDASLETNPEDEEDL